MFDRFFPLILVLALILGIAAGSCIKANQAKAGEIYVLIPGGEDFTPDGRFYQYEDQFGTLAYTDDPAAVPRAYQDRVRVRRFEDLQPVMPIPNSRAPRVPYLDARYETRPGGRVAEPPVTIDRERVQVDDHNVPYYVVREGDRVISVTRQQPRVVINR